MQKKQLKCGKLRRFAARGAGRPCAGARPVRQPQKTQKIAARIGRQFSETENVDSALGELGRTPRGLEAVLAYSLAPVFLDFMGFLASALKCCPSI